MNVEIGIIPLLFLFAPIAVVPLGLRVAGASRLARRLWPWAAGAAAASFFFPRGPWAGALAAAWWGFTALLGVEGLLRLRGREAWRLERLVETAAFLFIPVGGAWLTASRWGYAPMGFSEPIILLTAVHFHYTGFGAPILASRLPWKLSGVGLVLGTPLLAAGFVLSPALRAGAALLLVASVGAMGVATLASLRAVPPRAARDLLTVSAASALLGMALAGVYAVGEFRGTLWLGIPVMAWSHGVLNGVGFVFCGLLGRRLSA